MKPLFLHEGLFERISDRDPEGFPLTYPAWHRNSQHSDKPEEQWQKKEDPLVHQTNTTQRISVR